MADRKATNKYIPPDFDPRKHGSVNKYRKSHPLRERARKLSQGILIIRFEMPYNIWCDGCNNHIGMSVRYNAQKSKVGMYYSTPIYKFRMKCHLCDNHFEMQTDPKNFDYIILSGARRQENRWDPHENEQVVPEDKETSKKLVTDAMFRLEHNLTDKTKAANVKPVLEELEKFQERWKDDFASNQLLRKHFRTQKKANNEQETKNRTLLGKYSLLGSGVKLITENRDDVKLASLFKLESIKSYEETQQAIREKISSESIFTVPKVKEILGKTIDNEHEKHLQKIVDELSVKQLNSHENERSLTQEDLGINLPSSSSLSSSSSVKKQITSLVANYSSSDSD